MGFAIAIIVILALILCLMIYAAMVAGARADEQSERLYESLRAKECEQVSDETGSDASPRATGARQGLRIIK